MGPIFIWIWIKKLWFIHVIEYQVATTIDGTWMGVNQVSKVPKIHHKIGGMVWPQFWTKHKAVSTGKWEDLHPNVLILFWGGGILGDFNFLLFIFLNFLHFLHVPITFRARQNIFKCLSWSPKSTPWSSNSEYCRNEIKCRKLGLEGLLQVVWAKRFSDLAAY